MVNRHNTWLSDTAIVAVLFGMILIATVVTDWLNGPNEAAPAYLTGLLGASGAVLFGAVGSDRDKRRQDVDAADRRRVVEVKDTAERAERKADALGKVAELEHPEASEHLHPPFESGDTP